MEEVFNTNFTQEQVNAMPISSLAFVGDAVFSLFARTKVLDAHSKSGVFHTKATKLVNAHQQSDFLEKLKPFLSDAEQSLVKRARNTHTSSKSKNAGIADYKRSTAFETLLGFLFLTGNSTRLKQIFAICFEEEKE